MIKKRQRRRGAKKGTPFEREICKILSKWWTKHDECPNDNIFWRTSQSGGRATMRAKLGKEGRVHCSDLCAIDTIGEPFLKVTSIELKKGYHNHTIHDILDKPARAKKQLYEKWIEKADQDRERAGALYWTIIHQRDRRESLVITHRELVHSLERKSGFAPFGLTMPITEIRLDVELTLSIFTLDDFLRAEPKDFIAIYREHRTANGY